MAFVLETRTQRFSFGDSWSRGVSFDKENDLHKIKECMDPISTKDADFICLHSSGALWLIEVTDYRKNPPHLRADIEAGTLAEDTAQKVRDTIPALIGAYRSAEKPNRWNPYTRALADRKHDLSIILWLEDDPDSRRQSDLYAQSQRVILRDRLKQKLAWLTKQVMVEGRHANTRATLDIKVEDIPSH